MRDSDAQKSEAHEATHDALSSPASNAQQQARAAQDTEPGGAWKGENPREPTRTTISGLPPVESDDVSDAPPGQIDLNADLSKDAPFYPTDASKQP
jgi:hypothetical protein